jgi:hypothetical protein
MSALGHNQTSRPTQFLNGSIITPVAVDLLGDGQNRRINVV